MSLREVLGTAPAANPGLPVFDTGVRIPRAKVTRLPKDSLSPEECIKMFGTHEAVEMNFIPQMLTALALEHAEKFVNYCRDNRLSEYKRHNREIRKCIEKYNRDLRQSYGRAWHSYVTYLNRLRATVEKDLFKAWCTFTNEASRQYVGRPHKDIPALVTFTRMILSFVEDFDQNVDRLIASRLNVPCRRKQDPWIFSVYVLCLDIAEKFSHEMEITETMSLCIKILVQRCRTVVREIIAEEDAAEGPEN